MEIILGINSPTERSALFIPREEGRERSVGKKLLGEGWKCFLKELV